MSTTIFGNVAEKQRKKPPCGRSF